MASLNSAPATVGAQLPTLLLADGEDALPPAPGSYPAHHLASGVAVAPTTAPVVVDLASPAHLAAARDHAARQADALFRHLDAAIVDHLSQSGLAEAREAFDWWTEVAYGQDCYLDQSFDSISQALVEYERLIDAEGSADWEDRPTDDWRDDVTEQLTTAVWEARRLRDSYLVNPNTAEWTQRSWNLIDGRVQRQRAILAGVLA